MAIKPQIARMFDESHPQEKEQFDFVYDIISGYNIISGNKLGDGFLFGNINTNNRSELDAILMTTKYFIGLEFKNYGEEDRIVEISANKWQILKKDRTPEIKEDGTELIVMGGSKNTPLLQASINHRNITEDIKKICGNIPVYYIIIFNKSITIEIKPDLKIPDWLQITDNKNLISALNALPENTVSMPTVSKIEEYLLSLGVKVNSKYIGSIETATALCDKAQYLKNNNNTLYDDALRIIRFSSDEYVRVIRIRCYLGKGDYTRAIKEIAEAEQRKIKEAFYYEARMFEYGLGVSVNLKKAKELYQKAQELGMEEAKDGFNRLELLEKEKQAQIERKEKERVAKVKEEVVSKIIDTHDKSTNILIKTVGMCSLLYIIGHFLGGLSVEWSKYFIWAAFALPCILCILIALYDKAVSPLAENLTWEKFTPPLMIDGNYKTYTTVYGEKVEMIFHKALSLTFMIGLWSIIYGLIYWIAHMEYIEYIDFKYFPTREFLLTVANFYWKIACLVACFWILQSIVRIDKVNNFIDPYVGGLKAGSGILKYWSKLGLYILKPCVLIAFFTVIPDLVISTVHEKKHEITEVISRKEKEAANEDKKQKSSTDKMKKEGIAQVEKPDSKRPTSSVTNTPSNHTKQSHSSKQMASTENQRAIKKETSASSGIKCVKVTFETPISFLKGISRLSESECITLKDFAINVLKKNPKSELVIAGSISLDERKSHLEHLALQRAEFIKQYFYSQGAQNKIKTIVDDQIHKSTITIYLYASEEMINEAQSKLQ